ncbi:MAG: hypothetical protein ABSC56_11045 [Solirubrobacteraceae bacterium]
MHYVPLTYLRKQRLLAFDARDEAGAALPIMTRHKSAQIAVCMLSALAQANCARILRASGRRRTQNVVAQDIAVPVELEQKFWNLAYPLRSRDGYDRAFDALIPTSASASSDVESWGWHKRGATWFGEPDESRWRAFLATDRRFVSLASDLAESFLVCVPLVYESNRRRIVKLAYTSYNEVDDGGGFTAVIKGAAGGLRVTRYWNGFENWLEGLPKPGDEGVEWEPDGQWQRTPRQHKIRGALRPLSVAIGLGARTFTLPAPAVAHAASCHVAVTAPFGIQIRQAQLTLRSTTEEQPLQAVRGARSLGRVDLYVSGAQPGQTGVVELHMRPWAGLIVRGGALGALLVVGMLVAAMQYSPKLHEGTAAAGAAALLVVIPSLLAAYAARDVGHPLCVDMLFGLRLAAAAPVVGSLAMAGMLLLGDARSPAAYGDTIFVGLVAAFLCLAWRLADRGIPHPSATSQAAGADE